MRVASYIAKLDRTTGDEEYGRDLRAIYKSFITGEPGAYDGASRFDRPDGTVCTRVVLRNLFVEGGFPPFVGDLPPGTDLPLGG